MNAIVLIKEREVLGKWIGLKWSQPSCSVIHKKVTNYEDK